MLFLKRKRKSVDDRSEDFEKFGNSVVTLRLVDEPVKYVVNLFPNVGAQSQKFAVNPIVKRKNKYFFEVVINNTFFLYLESFNEQESLQKFLKLSNKKPKIVKTSNWKTFNK